MLQLQKKYPKSKLPKELPTMRKKRYDNEYIEQKKQVRAHAMHITVQWIGPLSPCWMPCTPSH